MRFRENDIKRITFFRIESAQPIELVGGVNVDIVEGTPETPDMEEQLSWPLIKQLEIYLTYLTLGSL
ncbi:MAG: hypothetical protein C3F12_12305 [Candidatus Methylomirabilota bacterium]|nr:MAG: hypothetical protein C3F12_12305 [candidate division NC10 bacterium]